jgi:hypothetical protein
VRKQKRRVLVKKSKGKGPVQSLRHRQYNNIKMDLKEIGWEGVDWTHLALDRDMVMNLRVT